MMIDSLVDFSYPVMTCLKLTIISKATSLNFILKFICDIEGESPINTQRVSIVQSIINKVVQYQFQYKVLW